MNSSILTLEHLLASDDYNTEERIGRFLNAEFKQHNTDVLEYFFTLLSSHKPRDKYFNENLFKIVLHSRWPAAHGKVAHQLLSSPYSLPSALTVFAANDQIFDEIVNTIVQQLKENPKQPNVELQILESLALAAIETNRPDLYTRCYQRALEIEPYAIPFEMQQDRFCQYAVENGSWWAVKSLLKDKAPPHVFYKTFEDATVFAPISVLEDLQQTFPHRFPPEFAGRAIEYLCKRESTPQMFDLIAKITLAHSELKTLAPEKLWLLCSNFIDNPNHTDQAFQMIEKVWLSQHVQSNPYLLLARILSNTNDVQKNVSILRFVSKKHPKIYAKVFNVDPKFKSRFQPKIVDALLFAVNDATDHLLVESDYETEKLNALRQKILLSKAVEPSPKLSVKRKI